MAGESEKEPGRCQLGLSCQMGLCRSNNEDNFFFNGLYKPLELVDKPMELCGEADGAVVAAVCDGMGGEAYGEYAAWISAETLSTWAELLRRRPQDPAAVGECIREMNRRICGESARRRCRMGSTLALAVLWEGRVCLYNIGDSRIYRCAMGKLERLSMDHTANQELLNMGLSVPAGGQKHGQLTQYLGIPEEELLLEPYRTQISLGRQDRLLLCSDGLTDMLSEEDIALVLSDGAAPNVQALRLTRQAEQAGGRDNVTALVLAWETPEIEGRRVAR